MCEPWLDLVMHALFRVSFPAHPNQLRRQEVIEEMSVPVLEIWPPHILPWLDSHERDASPLLIDLHVDILEEERMRFDFNVIFDPISVRRGLLKKTDYYIGSTGAEISLETSTATITKYTSECTLDVNYSNSISRKQVSSVNLKPSKRAGRGLLKVSEIVLGADTESNYSASFSSQERVLAPIFMNDTIKWVIASPKGEKAVRDFLVGNIYLFAECVWSTKVHRGRLKARPSDVLFFDAECRALGKKQSLVMLFVLWRKGIKVMHADGFEFDIVERRT